MKTKNTPAKPNATLEKVARETLGLETLEPRHSDRLDFHDLSVWQIQKALQAAFAAGQQSKAKTKGS
jgi:hypothetical protein